MTIFNFTEEKTVGQAVGFYVAWVIGSLIAVIIGAAILAFITGADDMVVAHWIGIATAIVISLILLEVAISKKKLSRGKYWYLYLGVLLLSFFFGNTAGMVPATLITMTKGDEA